jgi:hypothetical protein
MSIVIAICLRKPAQSAAFVQALSSMHAVGTVALYDVAVLERQVDGQLVAQQAPVGGSSALHSLVAALQAAAASRHAAAPEAGIDAGETLLALIGAVEDAGLSVGFVEDCLSGTASGEVQVLAHLCEHHIGCVETALPNPGSTLLRRQPVGMPGERLRREMLELTQELDALEREVELAAGPIVQAIRRRAEAARSRLSAAAELLTTMAAQQRREHAARRQALVRQLCHAEADLRAEDQARIGCSIARARHESERIASTLTGMLRLAREILGPEVSGPESSEPSLLDPGDADALR